MRPDQVESSSETKQSETQEKTNGSNVNANLKMNVNVNSSANGAVESPLAKLRRNRKWEPIKISETSRKTINPIRKVVEGQIETNPEKVPIALSIGDPTVFGNLPVADQAIDAVKRVLQSEKWHGYGPAIGLESARIAIANYCSEPKSPLTANDIIMAHGCSGALELCINVLANPGSNILIPRPGFSIYRTLAEPLDIELRYYDLLPERDWEADIEQMNTLIDKKTSAIIVNTPSNPCGSVYSREHLLDILQVAERHRVPIISDDVYAGFTFPGYDYYSLAGLSENVPILSCGALTKRFLVPGWRVGWVCLHDRHGLLRQVRTGLWQLATRLLGPSTIMQAAVPEILDAVPQTFFDATVDKIFLAARLSYGVLRECPGLKPVMPHGAMYLMCGINIACFPEYKNDIDWTRALMKEESVICLPATCFSFPNFFRIVLTVPTDKIQIACERIRSFSYRHYRSMKEERTELSKVPESIHENLAESITYAIDDLEDM